MTQQLMNKVFMLIVGTALLFGAVLAQAQTYDFVANYSIVSNPNGAWSYGWEPYRGGPFTLMDLGWTDYSYGTQDVWTSLTAPSSPSIALAVTDINHPTIFVPAGTVNTHPGYNGENPVVRWTAPASGTYQLEGWFTGNDHGWWWQTGVTTTTDVAVLRGPFEVFSGFVESYNAPLPFSVTMPLLAGETVDLTVGFGRNGSWWHDSTGLSATFRKVSDLACTPPPAGMIGWWPGDGNAHDIIGGHNGTLENGADFTAGVVNDAFRFDDAQRQHFRIPHSPDLDIRDSLTIDLWVMKRGSCEDLNCWLVAKGNKDYSFDTQNGRYGIFITDASYWPPHLDNRVGLSFNTGTWEDVVVGTTLIQNDIWYHVAGTWDGAVAKVYVNGVLENSVPKTGTILPTTEQGSLTIGAEIFGDSYLPYGEHFEGLIDEVEIFNLALSAEEIRASYLAGRAGKCRELAVTIDITPGGFPNSINPASRGVTPVAILTTATFNAALVDAQTVRFGATGTGTGAAPVHFALQDVDLDGDLDLVLQFRIQDTGIVCGTTSATLTGKTLAGHAITGTDSVNTVGCR